MFVSCVRSASSLGILTDWLPFCPPIGALEKVTNVQPLTAQEPDSDLDYLLAVSLQRENSSHERSAAEIQRELWEDICPPRTRPAEEGTEGRGSGFFPQGFSASSPSQQKRELNVCGWVPWTHWADCCDVMECLGDMPVAQQKLLIEDNSGILTSVGATKIIGGGGLAHNPVPGATAFPFFLEVARVASELFQGGSSAELLQLSLALWSVIGPSLACHCSRGSVAL